MERFTTRFFHFSCVLDQLGGLQVVCDAVGLNGQTVISQPGSNLKSDS